jgi:hypothetical protein
MLKNIHVTWRLINNILLQDWQRTSLKPYVNMLDIHVTGLMNEARRVKREQGTNCVSLLSHIILTNAPLIRYSDRSLLLMPGPRFDVLDYFAQFLHHYCRKTLLKIHFFWLESARMKSIGIRYLVS